MNNQSYILKSFLLNQFLWFIPSFVAMTSPMLVFVFLGAWWVGENRYWWELLGASVTGFVLAWGTLFLIRYFRLPRRKTAKMESAARKEVERFIENFDYKGVKITEWKKILEAVLTLNAAVAREYGIRTKNPELDLPLSYVLLVTERISADLNRFLDEKVKFLNVKPLEWLQLKHIFYFVPSGKNKGAGKGKEEENAGQNGGGNHGSGGMLENVPSFVTRMILSRLFRIVGYYSVMIYSGKLRYMAEPEDQWKFPLQVSVWDGISEGNMDSQMTRKTLEVRETETASWIRRILAGCPEAGLFQQEKNGVTYRLPISSWGEILLSCGKLKGLENGMSKKIENLNWNWMPGKKRTRTVGMGEMMETDLVLCWISVAERRGIFEDSESDKNQEREEIREREEIQGNEGKRKNRSVEWKRKCVTWRKIPENVRPVLRFVVELEHGEMENEEITRDLKQKIEEWFQLKPEEAQIWFWSENEEKNRDRDESGNENKNKTLADGENEFLALKKFLKLCDSDAQILRERKSAVIAAEKKEDKHFGWSSVRRKSFFRSRLLSISWLAVLYASVLSVVFFVCGMLFAKEKLVAVFHGNAVTESIGNGTVSETSVSVNSLVSEMTGNSLEAEPTLVRKFFGRLEKHWVYLAATLGGVGLLLLWRRFRVIDSSLKVEPYPFWPRREKEAFKSVLAQIHAVEEDKLGGMAQIGGVLMEVLKKTDQIYSGQKTPRYAISFSELLSAQQVLVGKLQRTLVAEVPGLDYLRLRDVKWGIWGYSIYVRAFDWYRKILWLEPVSALVLEFRRFVHGILLRIFSRKMEMTTTVYALDLAGYYAIELYSGHMFYRKEEEPTRIFVTGQEGTAFRTLAKKFDTLTGQNCVPIKWVTCEHGIKMAESSGFWRFLRGNLSHFMRWRGEIKKADIVVMVTDSDVSGAEHEIVETFRKELDDASRQTETAPVVEREMTGKAVETEKHEENVKENVKDGVIIWDSDENLETGLRNVLKMKAEELRWRQEFRFLREYSEKHTR
ncbi:MAG: hypothetical protein Q4C70_05395 [Planctomycetia bacterium]|nr:hypothetical protein [Planctomycetia bacterium]